MPGGGGEVQEGEARGGGGGGATRAGRRERLRNACIRGARRRRPCGSRRVLGLIRWQAIKLWWKGATFRPWVKPPDKEVS